MSQSSFGTYYNAGLMQPVKWRRWSRKAFTEASKSGRPVFVNIGSLWSRWCVEMDSKVFSDAALASLLNSNFVCVRVDRDEMPHVDRVFQVALGGGYPVNCVLTPDGKVVVAANFLPLHGSGGEVGLAELIGRIVELWAGDRQALLKDARSLEAASSAAQPVRLSPSIVDDAVVKLLMDYDWEMGGVSVGGARRFPQPTVNSLLLAYAARSGDTLGVQASSIALRKMYYGGIMDQVGGGFHRSADSEWLVPSFEKLLADNSEVAANYADQYLATGDEEFLDALSMTLDFFVSELWDGDGFAVSLASEGTPEGEYYTWTPQEVDEALGRELGRVGRQLFGVHPVAVSADPYSRSGEASRGVVGGRIVLRRMLDLDALASALGVGQADAWGALREIRLKMRGYRDSKRRKPTKDTSKYTHPNMLAAEALLAGYVATALSKKEWLEKGLGVVERLKPKVGRRLDGSREGLAEDYAAALNAAITAYEVSGSSRLLTLSLEIAQRLVDYLGEEGFSDERGGKVSVASKLDSPNESPNSLCLKAMLRVGLIAGDRDLWGRLSGSLPHMLAGLGRFKEAFISGVYQSVDRLLDGCVHVVVVDSGDGKAQELHRSALRVFHPFKAVEKILEEELRDHPNPQVKALPHTSHSTAYISRGESSPFDKSYSDAAQLKSILKTKLPDTYSY